MWSRTDLNLLFPATLLDEFPVANAPTPVSLHPPETLLRGWDLSADIWNFGVMVRGCLRTILFTKISHT